MAVVVGLARPAPVRADTRAALRRARFAEWREGVWIRPDNLDRVEDPRCAWLDVRPDDDPVALASELFAPSRWSRTADRLVARLDRSTAALTEDSEAAIAPAFLAGAAALRHIRADPLLPPDLLPEGWPGTRMRRAYVAYEREFHAVARAWFRAGG
jgi:phenylacetic acid degradation operon negative regulatory protein